MLSKINRIIKEGYKKTMKEDKKIEKEIIEQEERIKSGKEKMKQWDENTILIRKR